MSGARYDPDDPVLGYLAIDRKMALDDQKRPYDGKKACFVPDKKEGFLTAEIVSSKGDEITVQTDSGEVSLVGYMVSSVKVSNRKDMWRHFIPFLALIHVNNLVC